MTDKQFQERIEKFQFDVFTNKDMEYPPGMLEEFYMYWSEPNKKNKMRFELEKTWELSRRLKRWHSNNLNWNKNGNNNASSRIDALKQFVNG